LAASKASEVLGFAVSFLFLRHGQLKLDTKERRLEYN